MKIKRKGRIGKSETHPVTIIISILGLLLATAPVFMGLPSVDAAIMLTIVPAVCCGGLLLTGRGVFAVFYIVVFLLARLPVLLSEATPFLTVLLCLIVVFLFVWAAIEAYDPKN
jgi:drug/metabolite transporter (DMT)-like permease